LFKPVAAAREDVLTGKWAGGLNLTVLRAAETEALGWYGWFKAHVWFGSRLTLRDAAVNTSNSPVGTCTGLMKMPYIRDSRRTVGIGGFVINASTIRHDHKVWAGWCACIFALVTHVFG